MSELFHVNRKTVSLACGFVLLLSAAALALSVNGDGQRLRDSNPEDKGEILRRIQESPDQFMRVAGNDDCPLRLVEAKVKAVPGPLFTELTGRVTRLETVSSVPEATLVNTSGKTITGFFLFIVDPQTNKSRGLMATREAIKPGETHTVTRDTFSGVEKVMAVTSDGPARQMFLKPGVDSEKRWLEFAIQPDTYITIASVDFEDGSTWKIKEWREAQ